MYAFFKTLLVPPNLLFTLGILGVVLALRWRRTGFALAALSLVALFVLSMPVVSTMLLSRLESPATLLPPGTPDRGAGAIVVLSAGGRLFAPEYGESTVDGLTLERLRYAASLQRRTGLPILVTGGPMLDEAVTLGGMMAETLRTDFHAFVRWVEERAENTFENAVYSRNLLRQDGVERVYLVTHAWHMPRALAAFEEAGLDVIAAATGFNRLTRPRAHSFQPNARALADSYLAIHELIGAYWYDLRYDVEAD